MALIKQTKGYRNRWIALAFMAISLLVISSASQLQWVVDAYILSIAGLLLTTGYLGDRLGRKPVLMVGLGVFALFSLGAALSNSTEMLIGMRAMMGIGAAIILPATLSILTATFREYKERAQAIALWAATFALGMGIGPLIGGWLLENFSWHSVFYINIPIIAVGLAGGGYFIENSKSEHPRRIDIPGAILSIAGLFSLVYAIIQAGMEGWTAAHVLYAFGAAAVLLAVFILWELRSRNAMLPLHFFKNMSFTGANVALTLVAFGLTGAFFFLGQFLQSVQGYSPLEAGLRLLPMALVSFISAALSAKVAERIGTKLTVAIGIFIAAIGFFYLYRVAAVDIGYPSLAIAMSITSLGIGMTMSPATNSVMGSIPVGQSGIGSAMNNTTRQVGAALGVAILGSILNATYLARIDAVNWPAQLPAQAMEAIRSSIQGAHIVAQKVPIPQLSQMITSQSNEAFTAGATQALLVTAIILAVTAVIALIILPSRVRGPKE
jgi:EmrB/QacA subfamily drug resistance transporter